VARDSTQKSSTEVFAGHRATKRFGQNFLTDPRIINGIVENLSPRAGETIVEIGPGKGALTAVLLARNANVVAIELDKNLVPLLHERFSNYSNFKLVHADALEVNFCEEALPQEPIKIVANLPYNISTAILQRLISQRACLDEMVLMLQKEVVERIQAPAGSRDRGYLSVLIEAYCETEKLFDVAPGAFQPRPKVWSCVIKLKFRPELLVDVKNEELLWSVVSAGFMQKRKTILNNLRNATSALGEVIKRNGGASIVLCRAGVELQRRAETLTLDEWGRITRALE
jgi:16S rRNA (adenine1518-N6/adenine1519-N6)-dimethyltransferase